MPTWHFVEPYPPVGWTGHQDTLAAPWGASAGTSALVSSSHFPLLAAKTVMSVTSTHWSYCAPDRRPTPLFVRSFVPQPPCKTGTIPIHVHRGRSRGSKGLSSLPRMAQLVTAGRRLGRSVQTTSVPPVGLSSVLPASSFLLLPQSLSPALVLTCLSGCRRLFLTVPGLPWGVHLLPWAGETHLHVDTRLLSLTHVPGVRESLPLPAPGWLSLEIHCTTHSSQLHTQTFLFILRPTSPSIFSIFGYWWPEARTQVIFDFL